MFRNRNIMPASSPRARRARVAYPQPSSGVWLLGRAYLNYTVVLQQQLLADGLAEHIRPGMGSLLFALFEKDDIPLRDLTARTGAAPSTVTEMIQHMSFAGLVNCVRDGSDKRAVRVSLTHAGRTLEPRVRALELRLRGILEHGMKATDAAQLRTGLCRVVQNLHEHLKCSHLS